MKEKYQSYVICIPIFVEKIDWLIVTSNTELRSPQKNCIRIEFFADPYPTMILMLLMNGSTDTG